MATYETVLKEINDFGKYQKLRYLLLCANASHRCKNPYINNDSYSLSNFGDLKNIATLDKCSITYITDNNTSVEKCNEWVFDKTFYATTLTEDWSLVCDKSFYRGSFQTVYFMGYLVGSIVMGILADK